MTTRGKKLSKCSRLTVGGFTKVTKKASDVDAQTDGLREDFLSAADPSIGNSGMAFETAAILRAVWD